MAERAATVDSRNDSTVLVTWTGLLNGDTGGEANIARFADKTVQAVGPFGVGGSVAIQGSNDGGTTWAAMNDLQGTVIALTDSTPIVIAASPGDIRPIVTAGDGASNIKVYIVAVQKGS